MSARIVSWIPAIGLAVSLLWSASASAQTKPGSDNKNVQIGYGLDKDQPFAGADPEDRKSTRLNSSH